MIPLRQRFQRINTNYHLAVTFSLIAGLIVVPVFALGIVYQICGLPDTAPLWIATFWVINNVVSGSSYIGTFLDFLLGNRTISDIFLRRAHPPRECNFENWLTLLGVIVIAPVIIFVLYMAHELNVTEALGLAIGLFSMRLIGIAGGCGTRMGRVFDGFRQSSRDDIHVGSCRVIPYYGLFIFFTVLVAAAVFLLCAPPGTLAGWGLGFIYVSNVVSGASYIGRIIDFFRVGLWERHRSNKDRRYWETILTLIGVIFSIVVGSVYVPLSMFKVIQSLPDGMILAANIFTTMGVFGGLCNRIGKVVDKCTSPLQGEEAAMPLAFLSRDEDYYADDYSSSYESETQEMLLSVRDNRANRFAQTISTVEDPEMKGVLADVFADKIAGFLSGVIPPLTNFSSPLAPPPPSQRQSLAQQYAHVYDNDLASPTSS